jgi:hypothetical protein
MGDHPSRGIVFFRIREYSGVSIFGVWLEGANRSAGDIYSIDGCPLWRCSSLLRHWDCGIDTERLLDDGVQIRKFVDRSKRRYSSAIVLDRFEFGAEFFLNVLEFWTRYLPYQIGQGLGRGVGSGKNWFESATSESQLTVVRTLGGEIRICHIAPLRNVIFHHF